MEAAANAIALVLMQCFTRARTFLAGVLVSCDGDGSYAEIPKSIPSDTVYLSLVNFDFGKLQRANFTRLQTVECMIIMDSGRFRLKPERWFQVAFCQARIPILVSDATMETQICGTTLLGLGVSVSFLFPPYCPI